MSDNKDTDGLVSDLTDFYQESLWRFGNNANRTHIKGCSRLVGNSRSHGGASCFPLDANGFKKYDGDVLVVALNDLSVGDKVLNKNGDEVSIVSISHKDPNAIGNFFDFFVVDYEDLRSFSVFSITDSHKVIVKECEQENSREMFSEDLVKSYLQNKKLFCLIEINPITKQKRSLLIFDVQQSQRQGVIHLTTEDGSLLVSDAGSPFQPIQSSSVAYVDLKPEFFAHLMRWVHSRGLEQEQEDGTRQASPWLISILNFHQQFYQ